MGEKDAELPVLAVEGLTIRFGGLVALDSVSFAVRQGEIFGLIGPNGAGKTTVFNVLSRFYEPSAGRIAFVGRDLLAAKSHDVMGLGIARTFQNLELFRSMTVLDNVLVGDHARFCRGTVAGALALASARQEEQAERQRALESLAFFGIAELAYRPVFGLPYGIQKLVELSRALVSKPRLVLLDEPAAGMNSEESQELASRIRRLRDELKLTVLLVEHDMSVVMSVCDRVAVLDFGHLVALGTPDEVQKNPAVIEAYLGEPQADVGSKEALPSDGHADS